MTTDDKMVIFILSLSVIALVASFFVNKMDFHKHNKKNKHSHE